MSGATGFDTEQVDRLLTTTRSVRRRLDLTRPVDLVLVEQCLEIALQAPASGAARGQDWRWIVVTDSRVRAELGDLYRAWHGRSRYPRLVAVSV